MKDHERKSRLQDKAARIMEEAKQVHSILTPPRHHIAARRSRDPGCAGRLHGVCYVSPYHYRTSVRQPHREQTSTIKALRSRLTTSSPRT